MFTESVRINLRMNGLHQEPDRSRVESDRPNREEKDNLSEIVRRFSISAGVFYSGQLCGISPFEDKDSRIGHLHLLRRGQLAVHEAEKQAIEITEPSLLFYPRPSNHRLIAGQTEPAEIVCASVQYGTGSANLLSEALPHLVVMPLQKHQRLREAAEWLFDEAFNQQNAKHIVMDRLAELLIIMLLRYLLEQGQTEAGLLAGLSHPQLCHALNAIHDQPAKAWTLQELASLASMSRSKFADLFRRVVGNSAGDYLIEFRIETAKSLLRQHKPVGLVAHEVGYENASALARVFRKKLGMPPLEWLESERI